MTSISEAVRQFHELRLGEHLACYYETAQERQTLLQEFAQVGLERQERVVFLSSPAERLDSLPIVYQSADELPGDCRPAVIEWLIEQRDLAREQSGLRVLLDAKALPMPPTEVVELETAINRLAHESEILIICLFDRQYFSADVLLDLATSHRKILKADHLVEAVCYSEDLSHHLMIEKALRRSEERYRSLVENQGEGVVILNRELVIEFANLAAGYTMGTTPEDLIGRRLYDLVAPDQAGLLEKQRSLRQAGESSTYELAVLTLDGRRRHLLVTATPRFDTGGQFNGSFAVYRDITERKDREDRLQYQATHDLLTGLHNRAYFEEQMQRLEHNRHEPVSIIVIDLDNLKVVNDAHGHTAGDELLRQTARLLQSTFRALDTVVRLGGDEFAVLLPGIEAEHLQQTLTRLKNSLQNDQGSANERPAVDFSYGGATAGLRETLMQAFEKADAQMYAMKREKKLV